jgi:hypothetical protein
MVITAKQARVQAELYKNKLPQLELENILKIIDEKSEKKTDGSIFRKSILRYTDEKALELSMQKALRWFNNLTLVNTIRIIR